LAVVVTGFAVVTGAMVTVVAGLAVVVTGFAVVTGAMVTVVAGLAVVVTGFAVVATGFAVVADDGITRETEELSVMESMVAAEAGTATARIRVVRPRVALFFFIRFSCEWRPDPEMIPVAAGSVADGLGTGR
jgi:hypothetical protein